MDIRLTPQQNAQKYFKLYNKAKTAEEMLTTQIAEGEAELSYLESVLQSIDEAENERDLVQLREELVQTGVLSRKQTKNKRQQKRRHRCRLSTGRAMVFRFGRGRITCKTICSA